MIITDTYKGRKESISNNNGNDLVRLSEKSHDPNYIVNQFNRPKGSLFGKIYDW